MSISAINDIYQLNEILIIIINVNEYDFLYYVVVIRAHTMEFDLVKINWMCDIDITAVWRIEISYGIDRFLGVFINSLYDENH